MEPDKLENYEESNKEVLGSKTLTKIKGGKTGEEVQGYGKGVGAESVEGYLAQDLLEELQTKAQEFEVGTQISGIPEEPKASRTLDSSK